MAPTGRSFAWSSRVRWLLLLVLVACVDEPVGGPSITSRVERVSFPLRHVPEHDVLFVVDNSPAMAQHRARILANASNFTWALETGAPSPIDFHVGVITTDADGVLRSGGELAAMLDVGASGSVTPRPLEAIHRALTDPRNAAFRRSTADLAIVVLTNDDDHSAGDIVEYADFLRDLVGPKRLLTIGAAMGPTSPFAGSLRRPRCASRAIRLGAFLEQFPNRATSTTICQADLSGAILVFRPWNPSVASQCMSSVPLECVAWLEHRDGIDLLFQEALPHCDLANGERCYRIIEDKLNCPDSPVLPPTANLMVDINDPYVRGDVGVQAVIECLVE